ncbi:MAG: hypothetical protein ACRYGL_11465, partial [Janthinobacterium lividum]
MFAPGRMFHGTTGPVYGRCPIARKDATERQLTVDAFECVPALFGARLRMKINGTAYRSVWIDPDDGFSVRIFDQTRLPWSLDILRLTGCDQVADAIVSMQVRGAPLIGAVAAYGLALALRADSGTDAMERDAARLAATRPTAINLRWAIERMLTRLRNTLPSERVRVAYEEAALICDEDVAQNEAIGRHGLELIERIADAKRARGDAG